MEAQIAKLQQLIPDQQSKTENSQTIQQNQILFLHNITKSLKKNS